MKPHESKERERETDEKKRKGGVLEVKRDWNVQRCGSKGEQLEEDEVERTRSSCFWMNHLKDAC